MKQILVMMAAMVLVGCGEYREAMDKKIAKAKADEEAKASKTPQQTKTKSEKLIADPIVEKAVRKSLEKPKGKLTEADLEKVIFLNLSDTQITDASLKEVAKLQKLHTLYLNRTQITDEGLKEVVKLQNLLELNLGNTKVTKSGVAELKKALPNCDIYGP